MRDFITSATLGIGFIDAAAAAVRNASYISSELHTF